MQSGYNNDHTFYDSNKSHINMKQQNYAWQLRMKHTEPNVTIRY